MSELTYVSREFDLSNRPETTDMASVFEITSMREKLETLRDVMISLGLQIVFRATILLRRWNY